MTSQKLHITVMLEVGQILFFSTFASPKWSPIERAPLPYGKSRNVDPISSLLFTNVA